MSWTKVDQTDFYALCVIDPGVAEKVKRIGNEQGRHVRDVLRSAVNQMAFDRRGPPKEFWDSLTPEQRSEHSRKASLKRWNPDRSDESKNRGSRVSQKPRAGRQQKDLEAAPERQKTSGSKRGS